MRGDGGDFWDDNSVWSATFREEGENVTWGDSRKVVAARVLIFIVIAVAVNRLLITNGAWWLVSIALLVLALLAQRVVRREPIWGPLALAPRLSRWLIVAWLAPASFAVLAMMVAPLLPGVHWSVRMEQVVKLADPFLMGTNGADIQQAIYAVRGEPIAMFIGLVIWGLLSGATDRALWALGEEVAWRGYLLRELGRFGFWKSSLFIGCAWGLWYSPAILVGRTTYIDHPREGVLLMMVFGALYSPILAYVRIKARTILAPAILHATMGTTMPLALVFIGGGSDLTVGVYGAAGLMVLAAVDLAIWRLIPLSSDEWQTTLVTAPPAETLHAGKESGALATGAYRRPRLHRH